MEWIISYAAAGMLALGFALMFHIRPAALAPTVLGSILCWAIYSLSRIPFPVFFACALASLFCGVYCELLAKIYKAPTTIFVICTVISLIPGRGLFYTVSYAIRQQPDLFRETGLETLQWVLGIAAGIGLFFSFYKLIKKIFFKKDV